MRAFLGFIVGLVVAIALSTLIDRIGFAMAGLRPGTVVPLPAAVAAVVLLSWSAGTLGGALVAGFVGRAVWPGYAIALFIVAAAVYTILQTGLPWWVWLGGIAGPLVAAWVAARIAVRPA